MSTLRLCPLLLLIAAAPALAQKPLVLVENGRSRYCVYRAAGAPPSVQQAAAELQRVIREATGVELPLSTTPTPPLICVGDNPFARAAGVSSEGLPDDGFRVVTRAPDLYLVGRDLAEDRPPQRGWTSLGTLYGAYDFLERVVGARWLMPGDCGEEIPRLARLVVPPLNLTEKPDFPLRYLVDLGDRRPPGDNAPNAPLLWQTRQKLPVTVAGRKLDHGHAWDQYLKPADWAAHPEWMAMDDQGRRRDFSARPAGVKYCTTNKELVRAFAAGVSTWLDEHPAWRGASISPADGGDFCCCPDCLKLVTKDPWGRPSYTRNILQFYNEVARLVAVKHPDRPLAGYVYYNYMYPPPEPVRMEPNVWLVMAPLNYYGFGLYKPVYAREFDGVIGGWLKTTPNLVYHNYGTWMRDFNGVPLPCARDILKLEIPTLHKYGARGVDMVGLGAWGYGAPTNYLYAKLMWDADTDIDAVYAEWLRLAYGPGAPPMRRLLDLIEQRFRDYKAAESPQYKGEMYELNYAKAEAIYLPILPQLESLYREAQSKAATEKQKQRLKAFGDNLIMMHWGLRKAGMPLPDPEKSLFFRSDADYQQFLADTEFSIFLYRDHGKRYTDPIWKGEWSG